LIANPPCSFGLSATSQQYFSLRTNQPSATSQQYFSLRTNQHQPSTTNQTNRLKCYCSKREILPLGEMRELKELTLMPQAPPARQFRRPRDPPPWATTACCRESAALGHHSASLGELALAGLGLELEMNEGARDGREMGERRSKTGAERLRPSNFEGRSEPASRRYIPSGAAPLPPLSNKKAGHRSACCCFLSSGLSVKPTHAASQCRFLKSEDHRSTLK
jgi:hypothetical protein